MGNGLSSTEKAELLERIRENIPDSSEIVRQEVFNTSLIYKEHGTKIKGAGALVLTKEQIWFTIAKKRKDLIIPLRNVITIETLDRLQAAKSVIKVR